MNMVAVDKTIRALWAEVSDSALGVRDWHLRTEEELLYEACVCMFSSQMVFEVAEAAARRLKDRGLLRATRIDEYEQHR